MGIMGLIMNFLADQGNKPVKIITVLNYLEEDIPENKKGRMDWLHPILLDMEKRKMITLVGDSIAPYLTKSMLINQIETIIQANETEKGLFPRPRPRKLSGQARGFLQKQMVQVFEDLFDEQRNKAIPPRYWGIPIAKFLEHDLKNQSACDIYIRAFLSGVIWQKKQKQLRKIAKSLRQELLAQAVTCKK